LFQREHKKSFINRQFYEEFDGIGPKVLLMRRGKIERETERERE